MTVAIKQKAHELGFVSCGITDAGPFTEFLEAIEQRIQRYPESAHLYQNLRENGYPKKQAEWAQSVIVCIRRYGKYKLPQDPAQYFGKCYLVDGRWPNTTESRSFDAFQTFLKEL